MLNISKNIINEEAKALAILSNSLDKNYVKILKIIIKNKGNIFISGVGKSGHIARKIASTMTSTGSPALYIHPTEASHGDLGLIKKQDLLLILSNSGKSRELLDMLNFAKTKNILSILITSNAYSELAKMSTHCILLPKLIEVGKNNIAPTTSTTMMLALGDAIALSISENNKFSIKQFGEFHPGGNIGTRFLKVKDIMHKGKNMPLAKEDASMKNILIEISKKNFGCIGVLDNNKDLIGIITDGDLRRHMNSDLLNKKAKDVMSIKPKVILKNHYVSDALKTINKYKITSLFIVNSSSNKKPIGIIHLHDCLRVN